MSVWAGTSASLARLVIINVLPARTVWFGTAAKAGDWLTETLSQVAMQFEALLCAVTTRPIKALLLTDSTVVLPTCVQFSPSDE